VAYGVLHIRVAYGVLHIRVAYGVLHSCGLWRTAFVWPMAYCTYVVCVLYSTVWERTVAQQRATARTWLLYYDRDLPPVVLRLISSCRVCVCVQCYAVLCCVLQVRFAYEAFRKLRPGTPLRCLHGGMKQVRPQQAAATAGGGGGGGDCGAVLLTVLLPVL
jgi:hypothetical protein